MTASAERVRLAAVAGGYVVALGLYLWVVPDGLTSPWFVFVATVCLLGLAFVCRPVVSIRLPSALAAIRPWEASGQAYRRLGVPLFGVLLRRTPLRWLNTRVYLASCGRDPSALVTRLEEAEASHFWAGLAAMPYMVLAGSRGAWDVVLWFAVGQAFVNAYPIAHLRLARHRLERTARVAERRSRRGR
jgi:hypothetical protein